MTNSKRDTPLKVKIEDGELVIRIGVDVLAHAAAACNEFYDDDNKLHRTKGPPYITISDKGEFARDVCRALEHEEEDGSSPLSNLFDRAAVDAYNDGCEGVEYESVK